MDKNYIFKHNKTYYLSWGRDYAVSDNIYGPYKSAGSVGVGHNLNELAHGSFFNWKGQFYHIWCYYIKKGFKYRTSIISYCHMDDDGKIVTDTKFLDAHFANGVGQYNASWKKIEAEWFYEITGNIKKKGTKEKGFVLSNIKDGDWIKFANVTFDNDFGKIISKVKLKGKKGFLVLRSGSASGKILGKLKIVPSTKFIELKKDLKILKGKHDIYLIFNSKNGSSLEIDWLKFE